MIVVSSKIRNALLGETVNPSMPATPRVVRVRLAQPARRSSLSAAGEHSPRRDLWVPHGVKIRLAQCTREQHRYESDVVRALEKYLAHH